MPTLQNFWLYHERGVIIGLALRELTRTEAFFTSYADFQRWAAPLIDREPATVKTTLVKLGLWRGSVKGSRGGPQLHEMQQALIEYAENWQAVRSKPELNANQREVTP